MNKILLIQPNSFDPIGLKVISTYLMQNNIDVEIINYAGEDNLIGKINNFKTDFVGVGVWTGSMILTYLEIVEIIKKRFPGIKIIVGGNHASLLPEQMIKESNCDFVVCGDGETATLAILKGDFNDNENGLLFKRDGEIKGNKCLRADSLDLIESIFYKYPPQLIDKDWGKCIALTYTSKGCPFKCAFCFHSYIDNVHRHRSLRYLRNEITFLKNKKGVSRVNFNDDNFFANKEYALEACSIFKESGINYQLALRVDLINDSIAKMLATTGCTNLYLGIESGSDRILKFINKNTTRKEIIKKTKILKKHGISFRASFMINFPTETKKDLDDTKKLALELGALTNSFSLYAPYPNTRLYDFISENYISAKLPQSLKEWGEINWFNYLAEINELDLDAIKEFFEFFKVKPFTSDELHRTSL